MTGFVCYLSDKTLGIIRRRPKESRKKWLKRWRRSLRHVLVGIDYGVACGDSKAVIKVKQDPLTGLDVQQITIEGRTTVFLL